MSIKKCQIKRDENDKRPIQLEWLYEKTEAMV